MPDKTFSHFVNWAFQALLIAIVGWGVSELSVLSKSVQDLNVKVAVIIAQQIERDREVKELKEEFKSFKGLKGLRN